MQHAEATVQADLAMSCLICLAGLGLESSVGRAASTLDSLRASMPSAEV